MDKHRLRRLLGLWIPSLPPVVEYAQEWPRGTIGEAGVESAHSCEEAGGPHQGWRKFPEPCHVGGWHWTIALETQRGGEMTEYEFTVVIERDEDGRFLAICPASVFVVFIFGK